MKPKAILFSSFLLLLVFCPALVRSIPQVAVLDALLPEDFDSAAKIPITDKLIEELVNSKKFVVLDRGGTIGGRHRHEHVLRL